MTGQSLDFSQYIAERTRDFTGREWVFDKIDQWLADPSEDRAFLLVGDPGTGKTTILARLTQFSLGQAAAGDWPQLAPGFLVYQHFCQAQQDATLNPVRFVEALSLALAQHYQAFATALVELQQGDKQVTINATQTVSTAADGSRVQNVVIQNLSVGNVSPRLAFDLTVRRPLEVLCTPDFEEKVVILVDSLDEARTWREAENILTLLSETLDDPGDLPPQVRFVLACRPAERVLKTIGLTPSLDIIAAAPPDAQEVHQYTAIRLAQTPLDGQQRERLATRIAEASAGNFLYARYVLDDWLSRPEEIDLESELDLPAGLSDIYSKFLKRELARDDEKWEDRYQPLLGLLAVARGDGLLPATLAGASGKKPREVANALRASAQYLAGPEPEGPFRIYHQSFRDFLLEDASYSVFPTEAHQALADFFVDEYADTWHTCQDEYALRYTATHLIAALEAAAVRAERQKLADMLAALLTDYAFLAARIRRGWVYELVAEFGQVVQLLGEDDPQRFLLGLLGELLRSEAQFITDHPSAFFQSCWNRGWWFDADETASFYAPPAGGWQPGQAPWDRPGEKLHALLERWRDQRTKTGDTSAWLRALRPPPDPLGSVQLAVFLAHGDESAKIDLSPDERRLVSGGGEDWGIVRLYDLEASGEELASIRFQDGEFMVAIAYSPRGDVIAVALGDDSLRLLEPQRLGEIGRLSDSPTPSGLSSGVQSLIFSPDGHLLFCGHDNGELSVWDMASHQKLTSIQAHQGQVTALAISTDGREVASGEQNFAGKSLMRRWRLDGQFQPVQTREIGKWITSLAYSPDGSLLACTPYSEDILVFELDSEAVHTFHVEEGEHAECLAFTPDGKVLLAGAGPVYGAAYVYCWALPGGQLKWKLPGHNFLVGDLIIFQGGERLLTSGDNTIRLWDLERAADGLILNRVEPDIDHAAFASDGLLAFIASERDETVRARRVQDGKLVHAWSDHEGGVFSLLISPNGQRLACGCGSGAVRVWDVGSGAEMATLSVHEAVVDALAFAPNGQLLATGSQDGTARLMDLNSGQEVGVFQGHEGGWVREVSFSPDGRLLLTRGVNRMIVWEILTQKKVFEYEEEIAMFFYSIGFTDDSQFVVVKGKGELSAWDVATGASVPVEDIHRQAFARLKMRQASQYTWDEPEGEEDRPTTTAPRPELILRRAASGDPVAWLPIPYGGILYHPQGEIWGVRRGGHFHIYALETT